MVFSFNIFVLDIGLIFFLETLTKYLFRMMNADAFDLEAQQLIAKVINNDMGKRNAPAPAL